RSALEPGRGPDVVDARHPRLEVTLVVLRPERLQAELLGDELAGNGKAVWYEGRGLVVGSHVPPLASWPGCRSAAHRPPLITGLAPHYEAADGLPASSRPASCRATSTGPGWASSFSMWSMMWSAPARRYSPSRVGIVSASP